MQRNSGSVQIATLAGLILILLLAAPGPLVGAAKAASVTAVIGDEIPLSGSAPGADAVYLFVTGPNLPANGVRLDNIRSEVVTGTPGSFTRAQLAGDTWQYRWNTRTAGGTPDAGVYTVYVLTQPAGRRDLAGVDYVTITVSLTRGGVEAQIGGEILVTSSPAAEVFLDGTYQGTTPLRLTDLEAGTYRVELRAEGYAGVNESVQVTAGRTTNFTRTLKVPQTTMVPETTTAPSPSPSPTESPAPVMAVLGIPAAACLAEWYRRRWEE